MEKKMSEKEAEKFLLATGNWAKRKGFAIDTSAINPEEFEEIFYIGKTLQEANKRGFRVYCDVNGVLYVYRKKE